MDIHRTFPDNRFFKEDKEGRTKLYNILVAYSEYNKGIGYCQGLNYVAGMIILVIRDEEKSFWLLVCLLEEILPQNYFTQKMSGLTRDCLVLKDLITEKFPGLDSHDDDQWNLFAVKWFVCVYVDILPIQVCHTFDV